MSLLYYLEAEKASIDNKKTGLKDDIMKNAAKFGKEMDSIVKKFGDFGKNMSKNILNRKDGKQEITQPEDKPNQKKKAVFLIGDEEDHGVEDDDEDHTLFMKMDGI
jgi:hypothetical protein